MPSDKISNRGRARVSSFSKFQLPKLSNLDQNDLMSSVQSVGAKKDKGPPPSTRGFSSIPRQPSGNSGKSEEGFSGGYQLVMAQVEERRRLQSLGLAVGKKLASSPASTMPPSPLDGPPAAVTTTTTPKSKKRSSWQPPVNGKLQKSRSKSRDPHKSEAPTPTESMLAPQYTFSRIHNAPPTPPPEPRERMAREFVMPNAIASGSDLSFSKPRPPFAAQANSSTSNFAGSNASRSSLTSLTPSLDKAVYTLPPLSLGELADVFTNEDGRGGSSTSLAKYTSQTTASPVAISPIGSASPTLSAGHKKNTISLSFAPSPTCSSPLKRDLGNRKPSPPSAWKGVAGEEPAEERGRSRFDRTCHRYFSDEHDRRQALRKLDNLPTTPTTPITPIIGNILEPTVSKAAAATFSASTSATASTATLKTTSKATSKASSITTLTPASSISSTTPSTSSHSPTNVGNVPKKYISGADIEKLHPVTRPYVETGLPRASRIPSTKIDNNQLAIPPSPPSPIQFSLPASNEASTWLPDAMASTESILPPPPIPPRAPARASRDSSLARQMTSDLRQVQTISDLDDSDDDEADTFEVIPPLKPGRNQLTNVPSIGDMMRELNNDNWSEVDVPIRRPTLPRVPNAIPAMHKRQSEIPSMGRLPVRPSGYDHISTLHVSHVPRPPKPESPAKYSSEDISSDNLPSPLPSPLIPALGEETSDSASPYTNEKARVSRVLVRPPSTLSDHQSIEEKRRSTDSSKFKFLKFHHRSKTQPAESSSSDPSDVTDSLLPPHERADWKTEDGRVSSPQSIKLALTRRDTGLPSPALTDSSSLSLHPPSKASASSSSTSLTVPDDPSRSKIKVFTICCGCHAWHDLPAKYYTVLFTKVAPVDCIWCKHQMSNNCCEAWTATTNLVERHI